MRHYFKKRRTFVSKYSSMNHFIRFLVFLSRFRYLIVLFLGFVFLGFVGENSYMAHVSHQETMDELRKEIQEYERQYKENTEKLNLLETDVEAIKAVARERYFMKAANEDVFIIKE